MKPAGSLVCCFAVDRNGVVDGTDQSVCVFSWIAATACQLNSHQGDRILEPESNGRQACPGFWGVGYMLSYLALGMIFFLIIVTAAIIVWLGSLPGKIARRRGHPYPDAVNVASWMGIFTVILWPLVFIWAYFPFPWADPPPATDSSGEAAADRGLEERLAALEATVQRLQAQQADGSS